MTDTEKAALERRIDELCAEVEQLKEREQNLVTVLRNDCDIEASWDGLRKFWYIGLTENGCLMRDMACKAEAENAKLWQERREYQTAIDSLVDECTDHKDENAKLLRLLRALALCADDNADCDKCVMNGAVCSSVRQTFCDEMADELRAVGIEVD